MIHVKLDDEPGRQAAVGRYAPSGSAPIEPFERITSLVRTVLGVPMCAVTFIDGDRQRIHTRQGFDLEETRRDESFCQHTIASPDPLVVTDATRDARFADNRLVLEGALTSYAGVALTTPDGYNLGALCAMDTAAREFSQSDIDLLARFAALVVEELELRTIAGEDSLTGAMTRRALVEEGRRAIDRFWRYDRSAALLILDLDHFKSINDTFGHPAGDTVLREVSQMARTILRPSDMLGRLGGEEFGVLLPETDRTAALACAERLREAIRALDLRAVERRRLTASFGLAAMHEGLAGFDAWLAEADAALYHAKRGGRDRCVDSFDLLAPPRVPEAV